MQHLGGYLFTGQDSTEAMLNLLLLDARPGKEFLTSICRHWGITHGNTSHFLGQMELTRYARSISVPVAPLRRVRFDSIAARSCHVNMQPKTLPAASGRIPSGRQSPQAQHRLARNLP